MESIEEIRALRRQARSASPLILTREAVKELLRRFQQGTLGARALESIANELEAVDEIDYEQGAESVISAVLFELATPKINRPLTAERTKELISSLD